MYKVTEKDLIGEIKDFPIEIVQKMVDYHIKEEGRMNEIDMYILQILPDGAFNWRNTEEGLEFWDRVIHHHDFDLFFAKYPKTGKNDNEESKEEIDTYVYYKGVSGRGEDIIAELEKLGGVNRFDYDGSSDYRLYFISPMTRVIGFCIDDKTCAELLRDTYTEKFLPEKKELIEIDGKRYRKEDVINRIKELKEEK